MTGEYRKSRCLDLANAPQVIEWAAVDGDPKAVSREFVAAIRESVPECLVSDAVGQARALIGRVERCEAIEPGDVRNIARNRDLWELRLDHEALGLHVRVYVTEIAELPHSLVALHAHAKLVSATNREIRAQQNAAIDLASSRWREGRRVRWGVP